MHRLKPDWPVFLDDFQHHWPTDQDYTYVDFVRDGAVGNGAALVAAEQPTKFELVVNTKTARSLGLNLSPSMQCAPTR